MTLEMIEELGERPTEAQIAKKNGNACKQSTRSDGC